MAHDEPKTGITAPLYARTWQNQSDPDFSVNAQVLYTGSIAAPRQRNCFSAIPSTEGNSAWRLQKIFYEDGKSDSRPTSAPPTLLVLTSGWAVMTQGKRPHKLYLSKQIHRREVPAPQDH
ncbi:uncharacterized protein LOC116738601 [Nasonia vitripennis]|uniref:Uncharacterized protein n=1 Tax=Nasonia vitripennis TaxID=7425 RepID=A0A7M7R2T5_NASVI|nr:uncharacterized protein LOC116738601 [Nasonia vitripennis]